MIRICGLDEVGRGAFAGPLVAAAVVIRGPIAGLAENCPVPIRDSKLLDHNQRLLIAKYLAHKRVRHFIEEISAQQINEKGMGWANKEIFIRLISKLKASKYVIDGNLKFELGGVKVQSRIKADTKVLQVKIASILAKLHRDKLMRVLHKQFPVYNWKVNKGYGTSRHQAAITEFGPCEQHRTLWIKTWMERKKANPERGLA